MTYMGRPYYPWWLAALAEDVTGEGAAIQGVLQGAEEVRTLVTRNSAGQAQRIVVNHRPRSSVLLFARLMGEKYGGTPLAKYFRTDEV